MNAFCNGCKLVADPRPSSVVIFVSTTARAGVTQERTALPSTRTVQAPHCAMPQPNLAALSSKSLRRTYSNGVSGAAATVRRRPLTLSVTAISFLLRNRPPQVRTRRARTLLLRRKRCDAKRFRLPSHPPFSSAFSGVRTFLKAPTPRMDCRAERVPSGRDLRVVQVRQSRSVFSLERRDCRRRRRTVIASPEGPAPRRDWHRACSARPVCGSVHRAGGRDEQARPGRRRQRHGGAQVPRVVARGRAAGRVESRHLLRGTAARIRSREPL